MGSAHFWNSKFFFCLNSLPTSGDFCHLLITFANSLDPDQAGQNIGPDLDPNCLTLWCYSWKIFLGKVNLNKIHRWQKSMQNYPACKELKVLWFRTNEPLLESIILPTVKNQFNLVALHKMILFFNPEVLTFFLYVHKANAVGMHLEVEVFKTSPKPFGGFSPYLAWYKILFQGFLQY